MRTFYYLFFLLCSTTGFAQIAPLVCGTTPHETADQRQLEHRLQQHLLTIDRNSDAATKVPIYVHALSSNGSDGVTDQDLNRGLARINEIFFDIGIEFYYSGVNRVTNADLYNYNNTNADAIGGADSEGSYVTLVGSVNDAVNMYVVGSISLDGNGGVAGYAYFPADLPQTTRIFMEMDSYYDETSQVLAHEFGHHFGLHHTFVQDNDSDGQNDEIENIARSGANQNCDTNGDFLCDTPADPGAQANAQNACSYGGSSTDPTGQAYSGNTSMDNYMSYWNPFLCSQDFTAGQYARMTAGRMERETHTSYAYDAAPTTVAVPTNLAAQMTNTGAGVELSWTDAANNETGYLVERSSTSATAGFRPLPGGGTAPDVTSFSDETVTGNTDYWYRVKPSNGEADTYSAVQAFTTDAIYCRTSTTQDNCNSGGEFISQVQFGSNAANASGCEPDGYAGYRNTSNYEAEANQTYALAVNITSFYPNDEVVAYIDWNRNGNLTDPGESLPFASPGATNQQNITVPSDAQPGNTLMRIVVNYAPNGATAPCGTRSFGEAEDYTLSIVNSSVVLPVELTKFTARAEGDNHVLRWETATEQDAASFTVEHSRDGDRFEELTTLAAAGDSDELREYHYVHARPEEGTHLYRLRQTDRDGTSSYSHLVTLERASQSVVHVYPNPTRDILQLTYPQTEKLSVELRDLNGRALLRATGVQQLDLSEVPVGVYLLRWRSDGASGVLRVVRQ